MTNFSSLKIKTFAILIIISNLINYSYGQSLQEILQESIGESSINNFFGTDFNSDTVSTDESILPNQLELQNEIFTSNINKRTNIENYYSNRANKLLNLQGYNFFANIFKSGIKKDDAQIGALQDDYVLGVKDEIIIVLQGGKNQVLRKKVSKDGMIILGFGNPISAYGRTLKDVKDEIKSLVKKSFLETDAYISLASIKRISVVVSGEVNIPGPIKLSGTSSLLEALVYSGVLLKEAH